jgi:hypothetical protein
MKASLQSGFLPSLADSNPNQEETGMAEASHSLQQTSNTAPPLSTPLMAVEPIVDHRMSQRFRLLAVAGDDFPCAFNITGMNGYAPLIPFDPGADGVPYTSVFHQGTLRSN